MSDGKVVLITGASSGFGELISKELAKRGHRVFAGMRDIDGRNAPAAEALLAWGRENEHEIEVVDLDVTDQAGIDRATDEVLRRAGRVDVLVNNAGIAQAGHTENFTPEQFQAILDVNLIGPFRLARAVLPTMREQGEGLLIHVTSVLGRIVVPFFGLYNSTKFGLEGLSESWHYELAPLGIESVTVEPGVYKTRILDSIMTPADEARVASYGDLAKIPEQMTASFVEAHDAEDAQDPQEVADAVADLLDAPAGTRPVRVQVGADFSVVQELNAHTGEVQKALLASFGM